MASICGSPVCAGGKPKMKFTYTGDYVVRKDGVVELHSSGTLVFLEQKVIDLFMVGGGGGGGSAERGQGAWGGGGGGYTRTIRSVTVTKNVPLVAAIGAGAATSKDTSNVPDGGSSTFGDLTVAGGKSTVPNVTNNTYDTVGANGGSGGGGGRYELTTGGTGGSDGDDGAQGSKEGGAGQQMSTREFGEPAGKLYAGGGGGGTFTVNKTPVYVATGGDGGGGDGAWCSAYVGTSQAPSAGRANTGGGGGGGCKTGFYDSYDGAAGGSGIVCFREAAPLPELAGTWRMHDRLYRPFENFTETQNFSVSTDNTTFVGCTQASFETRGLFLRTAAGNLNTYDFNANTWTRNYKYWSFTVEQATAFTEQFRAWLASNATKQA